MNQIPVREEIQKLPLESGQDCFIESNTEYRFDQCVHSMRGVAVGNLVVAALAAAVAVAAWPHASRISPLPPSSITAATITTKLMLLPQKGFRFLIFKIPTVEALAPAFSIRILHPIQMPFAASLRVPLHCLLLIFLLVLPLTNCIRITGSILKNKADNSAVLNSPTSDYGWYYLGRFAFDNSGLAKFNGVLDIGSGGGNSKVAGLKHFLAFYRDGDGFDGWPSVYVLLLPLVFPSSSISFLQCCL